MHNLHQGALQRIATDVVNISKSLLQRQQQRTNNTNKYDTQLEAYFGQPHT